MQRRTFVAASVGATLVATMPLAAPAAEVDYNLATSNGTIFGTLSMPDRPSRVPVVLIVPGSGSVDRNGNAGRLQLNTYQKLASALAAGGIASVRYDKRGVAASHVEPADESNFRFDSYVADTAAWVRRLRTDERFAHVALAGHSEGSLVGMIAVQSTPVDAYISLEGAGFPAADILRSQLEPQLRPHPELAAKAATIITSLSAGKMVAEVDVPEPLMVLFRPSVQPYLISWFKYDPRTEIARVKGPVTIVQGTHDVQVSVENGKALAAAQPSATFVLIDGMTHVLSDDPSTTLAEQLSGAYADASRSLDTALVQRLITILAA